MTDIQLYTKFSMLSETLKKEVEDFMDFLRLRAKKESSKQIKPSRKAGLAKGLIRMKDNFDDPIEGFNEYV